MSIVSYLGIDVGSVTTKLALVDEKGQYIDSYMLKTAGKPVLAVQTGLNKILEQANAANTPIISSMGAGNKMDPTAFEVADIYETSVCPLARVMRRELKKLITENIVYHVTL